MNHIYFNLLFRQLKEKNIFHYKGMVLHQNKVREKWVTKWIMIFEDSKGTLKEKVINENFKNPGRVKNSVQKKQMEEMARMIIEISEGLRFIHSHGIVHRELKLDNIIVSKNIYTS